MAETTVNLDSIDSQSREIHTAESALQQATAMVNLTFGDAGEPFRNMCSELQDTFLWTLSERIDAAAMAIARMKKATPTQKG